MYKIVYIKQLTIPLGKTIQTPSDKTIFATLLPRYKAASYETHLNFQTKTMISVFYPLGVHFLANSCTFRVKTHKTV